MVFAGSLALMSIPVRDFEHGVLVRPSSQCYFISTWLKDVAKAIPLQTPKLHQLACIVTRSLHDCVLCDFA